MLQSTKKDLVRLVILSIMQKVKHFLSFENKPKQKIHVRKSLIISFFQFL